MANKEQPEKIGQDVVDLNIYGIAPEVFAEQAAQQQDEPTMQQHLKNAGQWALDCAQKVGTDILTEYLKKMTIGL